jgi:hypothetical protein
MPASSSGAGAKKGQADHGCQGKQKFHEDSFKGGERVKEKRHKF